MSNTTLVKTIFIDAAPQTVWEYLTDKDKLGQWFHPADISLEENGDYALMGDNGRICWGKVITANAPSHLVYTFTHDPLKGVETRVEWQLSAVHGGTRVKLTHTGFEHAHDVFGMITSHDKGWDEHLTRLRTAPVNKKA
jgi:uncharacterized protein YndB with AHSA1/START domain